jgi:hypothetical protein
MVHKLDFKNSDSNILPQMGNLKLLSDRPTAFFESIALVIRRISQGVSPGCIGVLRSLTPHRSLQRFSESRRAQDLLDRILKDVFGSYAFEMC